MKKTQSVLFLEPKGTLLEVIRVAKNRGFDVEVIRSDRALLDNTPDPYRSAIPSIDRIHDIADWTQMDAILGLAQKINENSNIAGVFFGVDPCAEVGAVLRQQFNLPTPSPDVMSLVLNKYRLRKRLREVGLSNLKSFRSSDFSEITKWPFSDAAYFKPLHGFFSAYVSKCTSFDDVVSAADRWNRGVSSETSFIRNYLLSENDYHVEESAEGELLSYEGISYCGRHRCLGLTSRILYSADPTVEMGSCFPYSHPRKAEIISKVEAIFDAIGFTDGPSHIELIVNDSSIEVIDFNPRFVGADVLQSINNAYGISIEEALLDWALGAEPHIEAMPVGVSCLQYILPPTVPTFESIDFPQVPDLKFSASYVTPGSKLSNQGRQLDYLGCYLTLMPDMETALDRSKALRAQVRVNGQFEGVY